MFQTQFRFCLLIVTGTHTFVVFLHVGTGMDQNHSIGIPNFKVSLMKFLRIFLEVCAQVTRTLYFLLDKKFNNIIV